MGDLVQSLGFHEPASRQRVAMTNTNLTPSAQLCRIVFHEMFDKNLLGFLYSSQHFQIFIFHLAALCVLKKKDQAMLDILAGDEQLTLQFNKQLLTMFSGIFVEEANCKTHQDLLAKLDLKLVEFETGLGLPLLQQPRAENHMKKIWSYTNKSSNWGTSLFNLNH